MRSWRSARRTLVASLATALLAALVTIPTQAQAAARQVQITSVASTVAADRTITVKLTCKATKTCKGTVKLSGSVKSASRSFTIARNKSRTLKLKLTSSSHASLTKATKATVVVSQKKPSRKTVKKTVTVSPTPSIEVLTTSAIIHHGQFAADLSCSAATACAASLTPVIGGIRGTTTPVSIAAGTTAEVSVSVSEAQLAKLTSSPSSQTVELKETAPRQVTRSAKLSLARMDVSEPTNSYAYTDRNWTPTSYDTCSAELHASYNVVGPDNKIYPTWHPAKVTDPATGQPCTFGHEHGADPSSSDIFEWVASFYATEGHEDNAGLPFGYASEALDDYGSHHAGMAMRHEDNAGHKVFVANNVRILDEDRDWVRLADNSVLSCDILIKQHQGSWSADATSNNAHELFYAVRCTDGTEVIATLLTRFGDANEFQRSCDTGYTVTTVGSNLPDGEGGRRIIPDATCIERYAQGSSASLWGIYEVWESFSEIKDSEGTVLASFDPWFGVRNPSRYYDPANSTATTNGISRTVDLAWGADAATGYPWNTINSLDAFDWRDPRSPFDGAQRDFYLNRTTVTTDEAVTIHTDPYGANGATEPFHGSLAQHLVPGSVLGQTRLATQKFDASADYGLNNGVHAPN